MHGLAVVRQRPDERVVLFQHRDRAVEGDLAGEVIGSGEAPFAADSRAVRERGFERVGIARTVRREEGDSLDFSGGPQRAEVGVDRRRGVDAPERGFVAGLERWGRIDAAAGRGGRSDGFDLGLGLVHHLVVAFVTPRLVSDGFFIVGLQLSLEVIGDGEIPAVFLDVVMRDRLGRGGLPRADIGDTHRAKFSLARRVHAFALPFRRSATAAALDRQGDERDEGKEEEGSGNAEEQDVVHQVSDDGRDDG